MKAVVVVLLFAGIFLGFVSPHKKIKRKLFSNKNASWVSYQGKHPFHTWKSTNKDVSCVITFDEDKFKIETVAVSAKVLLFDSKNTNRDSHGLEMVEALTFPKVNFTSADIKQYEGGMRIRGNLNFHGITRTIEVEAKSIIEGNQISVEGSFPIKLEDYQIKLPKLLFVPIEDDIKVNFHFMFFTQ